MTLVPKRKRVKESIETVDERLLKEIIKPAESESKKIVVYLKTITPGYPRAS